MTKSNEAQGDVIEVSDGIRTTKVLIGPGPHTAASVNEALAKAGVVHLVKALTAEEVAANEAARKKMAAAQEAEAAAERAAVEALRAKLVTAAESLKACAARAEAARIDLGHQEAAIRLSVDEIRRLLYKLDETYEDE